MEEYSIFVERAKKAERAFKILWDNRLYEDALSRGYYAIIHLCYAIFIKNNLTISKTHAGLIAKLWQNRRELGIEENTIKNISRIQSLRESGDYGVIPSIKENDLKMVEDVIKKLKEVLEC